MGDYYFVDEKPRPPRARVYRDWTPEQLRAAEQMAEGGSLQAAAAICEWLLTDDAVAGALNARSDALLGLDVTFEPGRLNSAQVDEAIVEDWDDIAPEAESTNLVEWGILLGVAPFRNCVDADEETGRWIPQVQFWAPHTLCQDQRTGCWTIRDVDGHEHKVEPNCGVWGLHTPYGPNRPWARGLWRSLARWVLLKQYAQRDWARHSEVAARLILTTPLDKEAQAIPTSDAQRTQIVQEIGAAGGDFAACLPAGWDAKMLELTANVESIYKGQIEAANNAIRIRIRGGDLSSDAGGGGSYAAAESQASTSEAPKTRFDGKALSATYHDATLDFWALYNWGTKSVTPWPAWTPAEAAPDPKATADTIKTLGDVGFTFDLAAIQKQFPYVTGFEKPAAVTTWAPSFSAEAAPKTPEPEPVNPPPYQSPPGVDANATAFSEALAVESAQRAQAATADIVGALQACVQSATSKKDLDAKLKAAFAGANLEELTALSEKAVILAEISGRYAALAEL